MLEKLSPEERRKRIRSYNYVARHLTPATHCERCGREAKTEGHHFMPIDPHAWVGVVEWLCRPCHRKADKAQYDARPRDSKGRFVRVTRNGAKIKPRRAS